MGKYQGRLVFLIMAWHPGSEKENFEIEPVELYLKFDLTSHLPRTEGLVNAYLLYFLIQTIF